MSVSRTPLSALLTAHSPRTVRKPDAGAPPVETSADLAFFHLLERTPDATIVLDLRGVILFSNHAAETMFGYGRDDFIGLSVRSIVTAGFPDTFGDGLPTHDAETAEPSQPMEVCGRSSAGIIFPVEMVLTILGDAEAGLVMATMRDIRIGA